MKTIVVGTDGSEGAEAAVDTAVEMAKALGAKLVAVSAYHPVSSYRLHEEGEVEVPADVRYELTPREDVNLILGRVTAKGHEAGVEVEEKAVDDHPITALLDAAEEVGAEVIVIGGHGMKGSRRILGSVPNAISHHAKSSVMIVNPR